MYKQQAENVCDAHKKKQQQYHTTFNKRIYGQKNK